MATEIDVLQLRLVATGRCDKDAAGLHKRYRLRASKDLSWESTSILAGPTDIDRNYRWKRFAIRSVRNPSVAKAHDRNGNKAN